MGRDFEIVAKAIQFISEQHDQQPSLNLIASQVGVSPQHFQRTFSRWAGISPKRMLQYFTALKAGEMLRRRIPVLETSMSVGLSSSSRLHDLFVTIHGMSPAAYREQGDCLDIEWGVARSPFGKALIAATPEGICWLSFHEEEDIEYGVQQMKREWFKSSFSRDDDRAAALAANIFSDSAGREPVHVMVKGSNFQIKVWQALLQIPEGSVATYGDISRTIDKPAASRAVGTAIGANPIAWVIPCHRVIRGTGMIGGYRWGPEKKSMMLFRESIKTEHDAVSPL